MLRLTTAAAAAVLMGSAALAQSPPKILSSHDAAVYSAAFIGVRQGEFTALDGLKRHVHDPALIGRLTYLKLMHPDYHADFSELKGWLAKYGDQPDADKVYALAKKRQPGGVLSLMSEATDRDEAGYRSELAKPKSTVDVKLQAARDAFYNEGDMAKASRLASQSGERWIGGLAAYRMGQYDAALDRFSALAKDPAQTEWVRSGAAFWAARSAVAAGRPEAAIEHLKLAAKAPYTFYGLIAERQLGLEPAVKAQGMDMGGEDGGGIVLVRATAATLSPKAQARLIKSDKRAKRAAAYVQIGQNAEAYEELRLALFSTGSDEGRAKWRALASMLGESLAASAAPVRRNVFDLSTYPSPDLAPLGGYTLERALVYAIVRQESRFNAEAASPAGALGLMQMTPATAALNAGVGQNEMDASLLMDPATNLRLGQDNVTRLLNQTQGDLLRTIAAYNAGPRGINKLTAAMPEADSLLLIESLAGAETRDYVQRVMANYWIYRRLFNQPTPTLDAMASGEKIILASSDQSPAPANTPAQPIEPAPAVASEPAGHL